MNKKNLFLFLSLLILLSTSIVNAASISQEASVTILNGGISILHTPDSFAFERTFTDNLSTIELFKALDPSIYNNQLIVEDADSSGLNYYVTIALTNLVNSSTVIPFSSLSLVTLSDDPSGVDAVTPSSPPAVTAGVSAPLNCAWAGDLQTNCNANFNNNYLTANSQPHTSDPTSPVDNVTTTIDVTPYIHPVTFVQSSLYSNYEIIEFNDGEKALVTDNSIPNQITVTRGILGTTATSHPAAPAPGSGITSNGSSSTQVVILNGIEPVPFNIGAYSVGFGFKGLIEPEFHPGDYTGTITYTRYTI